MLGREVAVDRVDGDDGRDPVAAHDGQVGQEIGRAELHLLGALLEHGGRQRAPGHDAVSPGVQLHRPHSRHHDRGVGYEARGPALDVEEPFGPHVGAEPGLGHQVLAGVNPDQVRHHRRVAVGDVAEGAGMDEHRGVLERLQEVGLDGVAHDHRHGPGGLQLLRRHRLTGRGVADDDAAHALPQVAQRASQREHGHHLGGRRDVEPRLPGDAVLLGAEAADDVAQRAVVDVQDTLPGDAVRVDPERVPVVEVVVHHGRQEVVGRRHGMQVAGQVEVEVLEGDHLAVAASGGAALDPEGGAHGGLADGDGGLPPDAGQGLAEADRRRRLALAERRRGDRGHHHVAGPRPVRQGVDGIEAHLGDVAAVGLEELGRYAHLCRNVGDRAEGRTPRDLDGRGDRHRDGSCQTPPTDHRTGM